MSKNRNIARLIDQSFRQKAFVVCRIVIFAVCAFISVFLLVSSYQTMRAQLSYSAIINSLFIAKESI